MPATAAVRVPARASEMMQRRGRRDRSGGWSSRVWAAWVTGTRPATSTPSVRRGRRAAGGADHRCTWSPIPPVGRSERGVHETVTAPSVEQARQESADATALVFVVAVAAAATSAIACDVRAVMGLLGLVVGILAPRALRDELLQLTPIEPDPAAPRAAVDLDPGTVELGQRRSGAARTDHAVVCRAGSRRPPSDYLRASLPNLETVPCAVGVTHRPGRLLRPRGELAERTVGRAAGRTKRRRPRRVAQLADGAVASLSWVRRSKSLASCRSCSWSAGAPKIRLTLRPR